MLSSIINNIIFARPNCEADWADNRGANSLAQPKENGLKNCSKLTDTCFTTSPRGVPA